MGFFFLVAGGGNAVPPPFAEALVRANLPELCKQNEIAAYSPSLSARRNKSCYFNDVDSNLI
ncbi:hypothetical protein FDW94_18085 [Citrobacter sp. wls757]|nr:hypothetical protein FDW94_18085 [Citrobacter sp. wls757]